MNKPISNSMNRNLLCGQPKYQRMKPTERKPITYSVSDKMIKKEQMSIYQLASKENELYLGEQPFLSKRTNVKIRSTDGQNQVQIIMRRKHDKVNNEDCYVIADNIEERSKRSKENLKLKNLYEEPQRIQECVDL